jgi:hypothetical protein
LMRKEGVERGSPSSDDTVLHARSALCPSLCTYAKMGVRNRKRFGGYALALKPSSTVALITGPQALFSPLGS